MGEIGEGARAVRAERRRTQAGIVAPNPVGRLIHKFPGVMSSPPTVTIGTGSAASAITAANGAVGNGTDLASTIVDPHGSGFWVLRPHTDWSYRHADMIVQVADPNGSGFATFKTSVNSNVRADTLPVGSGRYWICFTHYGDQFEIRNRGTAGNQWRVMVDGDYVQLAPYAATSADSLIYRHRVDFAGGTTDAGTRAGFRKLREIIIECAGSFSFMGLTLGPTDTVMWIPDFDRPKSVIMTDSYGNTGCLAVFTSFADTLAKRIGTPWMQISPVGGTGFVATNSGTAPAFTSRYVADIIDRNPDCVWIYGSQNDGGLSGITAAVLTVLRGIHAALPSVPIIGIGPSPVNGGPGATTIQSRGDNMAGWITAIREGSANFYVDLFGGPYPYSGNASDYVGTGLLKGFGKVSAPTGSGNMDEFYGGSSGSDGSHPTQAGHDAIGEFVAGAHASWISAGSPKAYWTPGIGLVPL